MTREHRHHLSPPLKESSHHFFDHDMEIVSLKQILVKRLHASSKDGKWHEERTSVAVEAPLTIDIEGVASYTALCSPDDRRAMAVGLMLSEGIIEGIDDFVFLADDENSPEIIRIRLIREKEKSASAPDRNLLITSSCGICGSADIQDRIAILPQVRNTLRIDAKIIHHVMDLLQKNQVVYKESGGTHAILIFDGEGNAISFAEDIGRHNALDKAIGKSLLNGRTVKGCGAVLSGRVSFEMVAKCSKAGIEMILAVSAPTSLALDTASHCGITLCAFVRNGGATLYTHPNRINRF